MLKELEIIPEDFILPQNIQRECIDYEKANHLVKQINDVAMLSGKCFTIFDYYANEFLYISENSLFFTSKKASGTKGYQFLIENFDEEDIYLMHRMQQRAYAFLLKQEITQRINFIFSLNARIKINDEKIDTIYRVKPQLLDKKGNIWLSLATIERTNKFTKSQVCNIETGEVHFFKPLKITDFKNYTEHLTIQELRILNFMANGETQMAICNKLQIKEPTYKRHRAEIYRKLGAESKIGAINRAFVYGIIS